MSDLTIIHHKAMVDHSPHPANSLEIVRDSLDANATTIEVDIHPLLTDDYLITHDVDLESGTTGYGKISDFRIEDAHSLTIKDGNTVTDYKVPLLSDLVALIEAHDRPTRLQLDFKHVYPFPTDEPLARLLNIIKPIHSQVIVSSLGDWQLRQLKRLAPDLEVGLDPMMYFDLRDPKSTYPPELPPYRKGAYGYHDDSLLSINTIWSQRDYVLDRCHTLAHQVPGASTLFVNYQTATKALNDGVNFAETLKQYDMRVAIWTVDVKNDEALPMSRRLHDVGFEMFISNTPIALAKALNE